jgi:pyruvate carboxylase subunit B
MPGGALTANTQMMRDSGNLDKFDEVIRAMKEVVERGGYGTSVTPVSQFYWQQAYANVMFGPWNQIAPGYGKMVLGYFGKTPVEPDAEIIKLASEQLKLEPTKENPLDFADKDETKSIAYWTKVLEEESIKVTDENLFIAASCDKKGIAFLKGESPLMVRKGEENNTKGAHMSGNYTVVVDGKKYSVQVVQGEGEVQIQEVATQIPPEACESTSSCSGDIEIHSQTPGNVWKILVNPGDSVQEGDKIMILEAMKMEIDIVAPQDGVVSSINVKINDTVVDGQLLVTME